MAMRFFPLSFFGNHLVSTAILLIAAFAISNKSPSIWANKLSTTTETSAQNFPLPQDSDPETQAQTKAIKANLETQANFWNQGDIDGFMETYWESEELTFSSGGQTTRGWQATKDRYKKNYNSLEKMGQLQFSELEVRLLGTQSALVLGRWQLTLADGSKPGGNFSLVLKKIEGHWKIIHDHTSSTKVEEAGSATQGD